MHSVKNVHTNLYPTFALGWLCIKINMYAVTNLLLYNLSKFIIVTYLSKICSDKLFNVT